MHLRLLNLSAYVILPVGFFLMTKLYEVEMPDGTIIMDVPAGTSMDALMEQYNGYSGPPLSEGEPPIETPQQPQEPPEMSHQFDSIMEDLAEFEGGYVNHPNDKGGETNFGISKRQYPDIDIKNLTPEKAKEIYYNDYYKKIKGDQLPPKVGQLVFDYSVHSGVPRAVKDLQKILGVEADGILGPQTLEAVRDEDPDEIAKKYLEARKKRLQNIIKRSPKQKVFEKGWMNRISSLEEKLLPKQPEDPQLAKLEDGMYQDDDGALFTVAGGTVKPFVT